MPGLSEVLSIRPGFVWFDGLNECEVVGLMPKDGVLTYQIRVGDDYVDVAVDELASRVLVDRWATDPLVAAHSEHGRVLATLSRSELAGLVSMEAELLEAMTGYRRRAPRPGDSPSQRFDPARVGLTERKKRKAKDLGISLSTLYDRIARLEAEGLVGLLHGNRDVDADPLARYDARSVEVVRRVCGELANGSAKSKKNVIAIARNALEEAGFVGWGYERIDQIIEAVSRGASPYSSAKSRRSKNSRDTAGGGWDQVPPGQVLQVDTSPCDFFVWSPSAPGYANAWAVFLKDVGGKDWSCLLTAEPPNARALGVALFRRLKPDAAVSRGELHFAASLPKMVELFPDDVDLTPLDPIVPGELHMDRGREGENEAFLGLCGQLGISIFFGRPRTGSDKPHVESAFASFADLVQLFPGHKGNNTLARGEHPERGSLLTLAEAQLVIDAIARASLDMPHSELRHPADPSKRLTIRQHRNAHAVSGLPLRIPLHQNSLYEFLPAHSAVVNGRGPTIDGLVYASSEPGLMKRLQSLSAGDNKVESRKLVFRRDPYDVSRAFWQEPGTPRWHVLRAMGANGTTVEQPFSEQWWKQVRDLMPGGRMSKNAGVAAASRNLRAVEVMQRLSSNAREQAREFSRLIASVPDPELVDHLPAESIELSHVMVIAGAAQDAAATEAEAEEHFVEIHPGGDLEAFTDEELFDDE